MPPRNLLSAIAHGAFATLAHPFTFAARAATAAGSSLGRAARQFFGSLRFAARAELHTAQWTLELLKSLEWRRFEELCDAYFVAQGAGGAAAIVQCRPWSAHGVGIKPVRALHDAMASGNVANGVLLTPGKFTQEARAFAGKEGISLVDGAELLGKIAALLPEKALALLELATAGDFLTPTCPSCDIKMIPRKSTALGRTFWGCRNYPACKQNFFEHA